MPHWLVYSKIDLKSKYLSQLGILRLIYYFFLRLLIERIWANGLKKLIDKKSLVLRFFRTINWVETLVFKSTRFIVHPNRISIYCLLRLKPILLVSLFSLVNLTLEDFRSYQIVIHWSKRTYLMSSHLASSMQILLKDWDRLDREESYIKSSKFRTIWELWIADFVQRVKIWSQAYLILIRKLINRFSIQLW